MADPKVKNITRVDLIEEASGEENLLVESEGTLKRLPSSNFSGGSGTGFDITGKMIPQLIPESGEVVVLEAATIEGPQTAEEAQDFDFIGVCFGENLNTENIYQRTITMTGVYPMENVTAYTQYNGSEWDIYQDPGDLSNVEIGYELVAECPHTYSELKAIKQTRPITVQILGPSAEMQDWYLTAAFDYSNAFSMMIQELGEKIPESLREASEGIMLSLYMINNGSLFLLILWETIESSESVLNMIVLPLGH